MQAINKLSNTMVTQLDLKNIFSENLGYNSLKECNYQHNQAVKVDEFTYSV